MFFHRFVLGELATNSYIIADEDTKNAVLFDAPDNANKILDYLQKKELILKKIFLTHAHFDHILALKEIKEATGAKILLHKDEEKYLKDNSLNLSPKPLDLPEADQLLDDNEVISLDQLTIRVIHTPGHTEGSVCYLVNDVLISGDTLFLGSIGRADFPLGNFEDEISSIKEKLMLLDDEAKVYPGHGFSTKIGKERKENPYLI